MNAVAGSPFKYFCSNASTSWNGRGAIGGKGMKDVNCDLRLRKHFSHALDQQRLVQNRLDEILRWNLSVAVTILQNTASTCTLECSLPGFVNLPASSWGFQWGLWCLPPGRRQRRLRGSGGSPWGGQKSLLATPLCPGSSRTPRTRLQSGNLIINTINTGIN